jgi:hypothetical protein
VRQHDSGHQWGRGVSVCMLAAARYVFLRQNDMPSKTLNLITSTSPNKEVNTPASNPPNSKRGAE